MLPSVKPAGGDQAYLATRELRYQFSPRSKTNYELFLKRYNGPTSEYMCDYLPWKYQLEPNSSCNLSCTFCAVSTWEKKTRAPDMPLATFMGIIDENPCLLELNLCPLGEPLLRGDDFFAMAKYSREKQIWTRTVTNATLLHVNSNVEKLATADFNEIVISIDSFKPEVYQTLRRGSNLKRVLKNVESLHEYIDSSSIPCRTKLNMVITQENHTSIVDDLAEAVNLGFKNISVTVDPFNWGINNLDSINCSSQIDQQLLLTLSNTYMARGIYVGYVFTNKKFSSSHEVSSRCSWPFAAMYIGSDLTYPPCCHIGDPSIYNVVPQQAAALSTPLTAWTSLYYNNFRKIHLEANILPSPCVPCYK